MGTPGQRAAILRLLEDEDAGTRALVMSRLLEAGARGLSEIGALIPLAGPRARRLLEEAMGEAVERRRDAGLRERCGRIAALAELEEFCWLLAEWVRPDARAGEARQFLDEWGRTVRGRLASRSSDEARLEVLRSVLGRQEGFAGNRQDYYNPANSLLDSTILARRGLPLTLACVYMFVGARAGLAIVGVDAPGHFLARLGHIFFDPFSGGKVVGAPTLGDLASGLPPAQMARLFGPASYDGMALRMVANVAHAFERREDMAQASRVARVADWLRHSRASGGHHSVGTGAP